MSESRVTYVVSPFAFALPQETVNLCAQRGMGSFWLASSLRLLSPFWRNARRALRDAKTIARLGPDGKISILADFSNPAGAKLWGISAADRELLERCRLAPEELEKLRSEQSERWAALLQSGLILEESDALTRSSYDKLEIEINRHCNYRCVYCPVSKDPKPRAFMSDEVFRLVIQRAVEYGIRIITLNHYSEPALDPNLLEKIRYARAQGLAVQVNTNASLLDEEKIRAMAKLRKVSLMVNLASVEEEQYKKLTGSGLLKRVIDNLRLAHRHGLKVILAINSPRDSRDENVKAINAMFSKWFGNQAAWPTDSRAGEMTDREFFSQTRHEGRLNGCGLATVCLNVSWEGKAFLCCQDFHQKYVVGDLRQKTIKELTTSPRFIQMKKWILGFEQPPEDFICSKCDWTSALETSAPILSVGAPEKSLVHRVRDLRALITMPIQWVT